MKIIIAGAGKVGFHLASSLSTYHDVVIIDKNTEAIENIHESLDVMAIHGDICNSQIYEDLSNNEIDYFICVTNSDESNLMASMLIDEKLTVKKKILRLQKNFYKDTNLSKLNIYKTIFPSRKVARSMDFLLKYPKANNVKKFLNLDMLLLSIRLRNINLINKTVEGIEEFFDNTLPIVGIERNNEFLIPDSEFVVKKDDLVYLFSSKEKIDKYYQLFDDENSKEIIFESAIIVGASRVGIEIAKVLIKNEIHVKIIEKDINLCNIAQEELNGDGTILHTRYGWADLLKTETLDSADVFITANEDDEFNIIKSIEAKQTKISKVITINNEREYYHLMHSLGLTVIRGEKIDAFYSIIENINTDTAISQKRYCGGKGIALYKEINEESKCIDKHLKIPKKLISVSKILIISQNNLILDPESHVCNVDDKIVVFTEENSDLIVEKWLYQEV